MKNPDQILLDHSQPRNTRIQAAFQLGIRGSNADLKVLVKALFTDPSPCVRHECAFSLGETASKEIVPDLIKSMETDSNTFVIHESALALGTIGDRRAEKHLEKLKLHPDPNIVESAEIALERLLGPEQY